MYDIEFTATAEKQLSKLERPLQERIVSSLERIRIRPYPYLKKLVGCPYFRLRVGDYRVILDIREDKLLILVLELGHRKNIYKQ
ncbi:type II toxin-antitoxin system RelE/ParE family toxin [Candidatus Woesearchaeota archaeon]|nr:type II toxin-antitoxin system RelE/ParE family toxin [Candidatus Woesearchaeota archaeon]